MEVQVKSVTIYIRHDQFEQFLKKQNYKDIVWTLTPGDPANGRFFPVPQVQVQVSLDTYYMLADASPRQVDMVRWRNW